MRIGWLAPALGALLIGCDSPPPAPGVEVASALGGDADPRFARATRIRAFAFPRDHAAHPEYRNEWWYFTGHLRAPQGRRFGFQLTLFRIALNPPGSAPPRASRWASDQLYMAHFALSDIDGPREPRFRAFERFARAGAGLAGATFPPLRLWLEDWRVERAEDGTWALRALAPQAELELALAPRSRVLLQGERGLSRKSAQPGNASYYYSIPRLEAEGRVRLDGQSFAVTGTAWLDREWSTSALAPDQAGWDWFSLQLNDGAALMYYQLRRTDGSADPFSAGTYLDPDGRLHRLGAGDLALRVTARWQSSDGVVYPAAWRIGVPAHGLDLALRPLLADQELRLLVRYWEGAVAVTSPAGADLGQGYVELTGYAGNPRAAP